MYLYNGYFLVVKAWIIVLPIIFILHDAVLNITSWKIVRSEISFYIKCMFNVYVVIFFRFGRTSHRSSYPPSGPWPSTTCTFQNSCTRRRSKNWRLVKSPSSCRHCFLVGHDKKSAFYNSCLLTKTLLYWLIICDVFFSNIQQMPACFWIFLQQN